MSMKKNSILLANMMAISAVFDSSNPTHETVLSEQERLRLYKEYEERKQQAQVKRNIKNGLSLFDYENGQVWAINQKNADRKARKLGLLKN